MDKKYLIVNTGSASKKYAFYVGDKEQAFFHFEKEGDGFIVTFKQDTGSEKSQITKNDFDKATDYLLNILIKKAFISSINDINGIGVRTVAPGIYFEGNRLIDKQFVKHMKDAGKKAPLHVEAISEEINKLIKIFKNKVPVIGISDSSYHKDMPVRSKLYGINLNDAKKHEIYRYGYHGISLGSIVNKLKAENSLSEKMIICHIGGGVSITAVKDGKSVDTTMGFTPLEGMIMATRVGDIDSGALIYLSEALKLSGDKLKQYLNKRCGLLGLSAGISDDVRELLKAENENVDAKNALDIYAYKIQKQIGAYMAALGGLDTLVFSGTVGERSFKMRERILKGLEGIGLVLDQNKNNATDNVDAVISTQESKIKIRVVKTDEMTQIARETREFIA